MTSVHSLARIAALAVIVAMLPGCMGSGLSRYKGVQSAKLDLSDYYAQRLADGQVHLKAGQPTRAIEAFRQASYSAAHAPSAYNGMAVAYARIGREDVARKLFHRAIALAPTDARFARNLARLDSGTLAAPALAAAPPAPMLQPAAASMPTVGTLTPPPYGTVTPGWGHGTLRPSESSVMVIATGQGTVTTMQPSTRATIRIGVPLPSSSVSTAAVTQRKVPQGAAVGAAPARSGMAPSQTVRITLQPLR